MARIMIGLLFVAAIHAAPAAAQTASRDGASPVLTAQEARSELLGIEIQGETANDRSRWSECIEPGGTTVYRIEGKELLGRIDFKDDGGVCFSYQYDDYTLENCFTVTRADRGYSFWGGQDGVFHATKVRRGLETCPNSQTPLF